MYENGNVFFNDERKGEKETKNSQEQSSELANEIVDFIMDLEHKFVKRLNQHYEEEGKEIFKSLRVMLPFTQSKMDWNINKLQVIKTLGEKEEEA